MLVSTVWAHAYGSKLGKNAIERASTVPHYWYMILLVQWTTCVPKIPLAMLLSQGSSNGVFSVDTYCKQLIIVTIYIRLHRRLGNCRTYFFVHERIKKCRRYQRAHTWIMRRNLLCLQKQNQGNAYELLRHQIMVLHMFRIIITSLDLIEKGENKIKIKIKK